MSDNFLARQPQAKGPEGDYLKWLARVKQTGATPADLGNWLAPKPQPHQTTWADAVNQGFGFPAAVQTYLARLKKNQDEAQVLLDASADPEMEGLQKAAYLSGGLLLKATNPITSLVPSSQEMRDRARANGYGPEVQALGGAMGDMVNVPDPASLATLATAVAKPLLTAKTLATAAPIVAKSAMTVLPFRGVEEYASASPRMKALIEEAKQKAGYGDPGKWIENRLQEMQNEAYSHPDPQIGRAQYMATKDLMDEYYANPLTRVEAAGNDNTSRRMTRQERKDSELRALIDKLDAEAGLPPREW